MTISANVMGCGERGFVAALSDGRRIEEADLCAVARALHRAGVPANSVSHEWHGGQRMLTAGQQVALNGEIRSLERLHPGWGAAA